MSENRPSEVFVSADGLRAWNVTADAWLCLSVNKGPGVKPGAILRKKYHGVGMSSGCGPGRPAVCSNGHARPATPDEFEKLRKLFSKTGLPIVGGPGASPPPDRKRKREVTMRVVSEATGKVVSGLTVTASVMARSDDAFEAASAKFGWLLPASFVFLKG